MQETWEAKVRSVGREDPLEKGMATHSSIFLIGGQLLYNIMLVSDIHQREISDRYTYVFSLLTLPPISHPIPPPLGCHRALC